jgi:hypothetical protein
MYKYSDTNLPFASAKLTSGRTRERLRATVMHKDLDGHVLHFGRLADIQVARCEGTMGNEIESVHVDRETEAGL